MLTRMMNICAQFHRNRSTKYRDIASFEIDVNDQQQTHNGQTNG